MREVFEDQRHRPMTKAIIFDLDSCLAAADEVVVVRTGVCGHPRGQRRSLTGFCEPSAWCGIWYLTYFVVQSISTPHQPYENTEDRQAERQDNAKNLCDTKYVATTSTFEKQ